MSFLGNGLHLYCSYQRTVAYNILVLFASFLFLVLLKSFGSQLFSQCGPIIIYFTILYYFNCCFSTKPWSKILYPCKVFTVYVYLDITCILVETIKKRIRTSSFAPYHQQFSTLAVYIISLLQSNDLIIAAHKGGRDYWVCA